MPSQIRNCPLDTFELHKIWLLNSKIFKTNPIEERLRSVQWYMSCFFQEPWQASAPPASLVPLLDICRSSHAWMDFGAWLMGTRSCTPSRKRPLNMLLNKGSWMVAKPELKCPRNQFNVEYISLKKPGRLQCFLRSIDLKIIICQPLSQVFVCFILLKIGQGWN